MPGEESDAGVRRRYLDNLMNIWQADHIESSLETDSSFSFLRFIDSSPNELIEAFKANDISFAVNTINKSNKISTSEAVYDNGARFNKQHRMLLVPGTTNRFPLKEVTNEKVMAHLCNVAGESFRSQRLHIMDPMYDIAVNAPPIDVNCSDRTFYLEHNDTLFDPKCRRALFGILPLEEAKLAEAGEIIDLGGIPPQGLLSPALLEKSGYSGIRVPEMRRFVTDSGKLATLDRLLAELKAGGHRVLLYFQMTRMMDLIEEYLTYRQYKYLRLDGSSKIGDRRDMVMDWQTRSDLFVFVLSTRAGGLGINLTAADTVIFYDSDWNPTVDSQAMDRAHRLGQTKQVTVYRLITRNSIEERILLRAKQKEQVVSYNFSADNRFNVWLFLEMHSKRRKSISTRAILAMLYRGYSTKMNWKNNSKQRKRNVKPKKPKWFETDSRERRAGRRSLALQVWKDPLLLVLWKTCTMKV